MSVKITTGVFFEAEPAHPASTRVAAVKRTRFISRPPPSARRPTRPAAAAYARCRTSGRMPRLLADSDRLLLAPKPASERRDDRSAADRSTPAFQIQQQRPKTGPSTRTLAESKTPRQKEAYHRSRAGNRIRS